MRLTILALFLCTSITAICQPAAIAPAKPATAVENPFSTPAWTLSKGLSAESFHSGLAPLTAKGQINLPPKWHWDAALSGTKIIHAPQQSIPLQGPIAKLEPIPTQWPDLEVEQIPTNWPKLKVVRVAPPVNPPAVVQKPVK